MKRIEELDFARVVAMLSVILIHVTSTYINYKSEFTILDMNIAFILNQITRFAVPLFILLSGASLELSEATNGFKHFYKRRITKIGMPYLFWFLIYYIYNNHSNLDTFNFNLFIRSLLLGQEAPHLYFIIIIFQFYLLYPFIKRAATTAPEKSVLVSFIISYTIQQLFYFLTFKVDLIPKLIRPHLWILFPTWLFYFAVGLTLTKTRLSFIRKFSAQNAILILLVTATFSILYVVESHATGSLDAIKSSLNLFTILVLLCSFVLWGYIGKYHAIQKATSFLAKHSLTIYFEHVLVLYLFRRFSIFNRGMSGMLLLFITVVVVATLIASLADRFIQILKKPLVAR